MPVTCPCDTPDAHVDGSGLAFSPRQQAQIQNFPGEPGRRKEPNLTLRQEQTLGAGRQFYEGQGKVTFRESESWAVVLCFLLPRMKLGLTFAAGHCNTKFEWRSCGQRAAGHVEGHSGEPRGTLETPSC